MARPFYLTAFLLLISSFVYCQDTAMQRILASIDDTAKVVQLAKYAYPFTTTDTAKAQKLYTELMRLSRKLGYPYWAGMVWVNRAYMSAQAARDKEAIGQYDSALFYLRKTSRVDMIAVCHLNIGSISERLGNSNAKVRHLTEAMRLLENTKYQDLLNHVYNSMGVLFYNQDDYAKGLVYFQKGVQSAKASKDTLNLAEAMHGVVNCLSSQKRFEEALDQGENLLAIATASNNKANLLHAHTALGELYRKWQKGELSGRHAAKILQYAKDIGDVQYHLIGLLALADAYLLTSEYTKSIAHYKQALQLGEEKGVVIQLDDIYKGLSEAYAQINQPGLALKFYKSYIHYRDSANNEKVKQNAAELDVKYQTAQREKALSEKQLQITRKEMQLQKSRQVSFYSIGATVVALLVALLVYLHFRNKRRLDQKRLQTLQQEKEIQLLQAAMRGEEKERSRIAKDLHDGVAGMLAAVKMHFSSVPATAAYAETDGYRKGTGLLDEAIQEVRKTSHNLMPEVLLTYGLDVALQRYCHNITGGHLTVQYDSWGEIKRYKASFELSVYRIVQELLNNILKHSKASQAIVQMSMQKGILSITVEDNGVGLPGHHPAGGMGFEHLNSRIKAMNGHIEVESSPGNGVSAYLEFETSGLVLEIMEKEKLAIE